MQPVASGANRQTLVLMWKTSLLWPQTQWLPLRCWSKKNIQNIAIHLNGYNVILWYIKILMLWKIRFNILVCASVVRVYLKKSIICIQAQWNVFWPHTKSAVYCFSRYQLIIFIFLTFLTSQLKHICSSWRCEVRVHWHTNQSLAVNAILVSGIDKLLLWEFKKRITMKRNHYLTPYLVLSLFLYLTRGVNSELVLIYNDELLEGAQRLDFKF